jgi:protoporphyrinogen/coproporphyrinogen III oxidase
VSTAPHILVVGGGISGLACAWRLRQLGLPVLLLERSYRFGGVFDTIEQEGFRFDLGPQSFTNTPAVSELIDELSLRSELMQADPHAPRYILKNGRLVPAPLSPPQLLLTPLLGVRTKLAILAEPFRRTHPPEVDESVAAFVRRKFGADLLANLVAPFISGVWAGDAEKLSLASTFPSVRQFEERYGSVIRGQIKQRRQSSGEQRASLCNFRGGLKILTAALAGRLGESALAGAEIITIRRSASPSAQPVEVTYKVAGTTQARSFDAMVIATPANETARLLNGIAPGFGELLGQIEYAGVAQVSAGYALEQINYWNAEKGLVGFGFLVPRSERLRLLGTVWNSCLFAERAPHGMASFTTFLGGTTDPEILSKSPDEIGAIAQSELAQILGITGEPLTQHVVRWQRALPQYNMAHQGLTAGLQNLCAHAPGIFLAGNYLTGPAIGSCIEHANGVARNVARFCSAGASARTH